MLGYYYSLFYEICFLINKKTAFKYINSSRIHS